MIGKVIIGKSFRGCISYCLNDKTKDQGEQQVMRNRAEVLLFNNCYGDQKELIQQFNEVRALNPKLSKPVLHITLSLAPGENLQSGKLMEICGQCVRDFGFENNQYLTIAHKDTGHQHVHIIANRVGFDKKTVSDSNNYKRMANFCRKTELSYGLQHVLSPRRFLSKEMQAIPRSDSRKEELKICIKDALNQSSNFSEFKALMKAEGYQVIKGRGVSFVDTKNVKVKGSEIDFSLQTIEQVLAKRLIMDLRTEKKNALLRKNIPENRKERMQLSPEKNRDISLSSKQGKVIYPALNNLLKPEKRAQDLSPALLPKKRKKNGYGLHF
jgi:hypothetical protein